MPFNIQLIDTRNDSRNILMLRGEPWMFDTGGGAALEVANRKALFGHLTHFSYRILKIEESDESDDWRIRERDRFVNGQYVPVPWWDESWYINATGDVELHYAHMSMDKTGMIAYTETPDKGRDDIQKRIRPGRYLTQHFYRALSADKIRYWAGKVSLLSGESQEYKIAKTPDEIERIYTNGPGSCMGKDADDFQSSEHPVRMYGAGDLGVAYIEREDSIAARVIVWPDKKIWGRIYGDGGVYTDQLRDLLAADGYEHGTCAGRWKGARLQRVENRDGFIAPYLDIGGSCLTDTGEYLEICYNGEIDAESESGVTGSRNHCDLCGEGYNALDDGGSVGDESYCQSCYEEYAVRCEDCECTVHRENAVYIENAERQVCDSCSGSYPVCDSCHEQFFENDMNHVSATNESVCDSCFSDDYSNCEECGDADKKCEMKMSDSGETLCESCYDEKIAEGEAERKSVPGRDENENQTEISL